MITTTYTCDRCKAEQTTKQQFWTVGVVAITRDRSLPDPRYAGYVEWAPVGSMQVCRPCLDALGVQMKREAVRPGTPPQPTLEEVIAEIATEAAIRAVQS